MEATLINDRQKQIIHSELYYQVFRDKTIAEIEKIHQSQTNGIHKKGEEFVKRWFDAMFTAQTVALDKIYRSLDIRFVSDQTGICFIDDGSEIWQIDFIYKPRFFGGNNSAGLPVSHIEFRTAKNSPLTSSGYYSHFLLCVPYEEVSTLEELILLSIKAECKNKTLDIYFE